MWAVEPRQALREQGITLLDKYPKCSQDLTAIETCWREVRARLFSTEPTRLESRDQFILRLRAAVSWVNRNRKEYLEKLCSDQKERARDVMEMDGGRTKH